MTPVSAFVGAAHRSAMIIPAHPIRRLIVRFPLHALLGPARNSRLCSEEPLLQEPTLPRTVTLERQKRESLPILGFRMDRSGGFTPGDPRPRGQAAGRSVQLSPVI